MPSEQADENYRDYKIKSVICRRETAFCESGKSEYLQRIRNYGNSPRKPELRSIDRLKKIPHDCLL